MPEASHIAADHGRGTFAVLADTGLTAIEIAAPQHVEAVPSKMWWV